MITLSPSPRSLGLHSPVIGPWFSSADVELPHAEDDLAIPLTLGGGVEWRPPVAGFLSLYVTTANGPPGLARFRGPSDPAFADGRLVAVFEVLPQAGERLGALMRAVPTLGDPAAPDRATRPTVGAFALEFTQTGPTLSFVQDRLREGFPFPATVESDAERLAYLGLAAGASGLTNGAAPMRDLLRPGVTAGAAQALLRFPASTEVRLWAFDRRGRALDPGAVACWWLYLATHADDGFEDLFAEGIDPGDQRTAPIAADEDRLLVQLVGPHEGVLEDGALARVQVGGNAEGSGPFRFRGDGDGGIDLSFTSAASGSPDDLPVPRMGVLPDGRFGSSLSLFPAGPLDPILRRDHVRVAVLSVEHHLTGQPRHAEATDPDPVRRRAAHQERASTRILVDRAERPGLFRTPDDAAATLLEVLGLEDAGSPVGAGLVAGALSVDWGPLSGTPADVPAPGEVTLTAEALSGGGSGAGGTVAGQRALLTVDVGAGAAGAWVRAWTQGFDHRKGERFRLDGGAGIVDAEGRARIVAPLPDGDAAPAAPLGADLLVVTGQGNRLFADERFPRPTPIGGDPMAAGDATGPFLLCEEGREVPVLDGAAAVRSGTTVVALGGAAPSLIDSASIPAAARAPSTFARAAGADDRVRLTQPAFVGEPPGDPPAALEAGGTSVARTERRLPSAWEAGFPLPGMSRLELVASASSANVARAVVGGGVAVGDRHGLLPHHLGHPMCPAGPDIVGTGADVRGPAVRGVAELVRERLATNTVELATHAAAQAVSVPSAPDADSLWAAGLRTVAAGVEAEVGLPALLDALLGDAYPFGSTLEEIRTFLSGHGITLPPDLTDPAGRAARALDRRFLAAARGAREGATALAAALGRAEDLVYIETPALDDRSVGGAEDTVHLLQILVERMAERPGLRVVLCLPVFLAPDVPRALQRIRDRELRAALDRLVAGDREPRVAAFSPSAGPGRSLKLATTTVVVDDAWAMVGTTHLWRRGLSYDASYAVTVFDDRLEAGRPQEVLRFRRRLLADRLGVAVEEVPDDPVELAEAVRIFVARGGFGRLAADRIRPPQEEDATIEDGSVFTEADVWNPDGSPTTELNPLVWALQLTSTAVSENLTTP